MRTTSVGRGSRIVLSGLLLLLPLGAAADDLRAVPEATTAAAAADSIASGHPPAEPVSLDETRELIKNGDYDRAIERLRAAIAQGRNDPERLRESYLQLIKIYVFLGNDYKFKPQGREMSGLNYRAARELIAEALAIPALRHTRPEPATDYPPEMIAFFADVRAQLFGAFRVVRVEPSLAAVLLDGDTLRAAAPDAPRGETDLPVGRHRVVVRRAGFQDVAEDIVISPGATLERSYRLEKKRGRFWYATRGTAAAGIIGGVVALIAGRNGGEAGAAALPGAPPPPNR